jgi:hypothetical protein
MSRMISTACQMLFILQDSFSAFAQAERTRRFSVRQTVQIKAIAENTSDG